MTAPPLTSPYRGLAPFEDSETDARLFFGRERERRVIRANLMASRLTVLYGASGVGKSSLLSAGVAHELGKTENVAVLRSWAGDPLPELAAIVDRVEDGGDLYVILDQLEEFFVYHGVNGPATSLAAALADLIHHRRVRVSVLLGIREESLARLDAFKPQLPNVLANYLRLEHLERAAARGAITEPLRRFEELGGGHWVIEPLLVEAVLDEVSAGQIDGGAAPPGHVETPYLQLVMQRLWEAEREKGSSVLRLETLRELGGAQRIVREHLERALAALTPDQQDAAARMFRHLVTPSGAKIAHHVGDLISYAGVEAAAAGGVITRLEGERIVRPIEHGRVEIYHDVLGDPISRWRRNYEATREVRRARRRARRLAAVAAGSLVALVVMSAIAVYALNQRSVAREKAALAQAAVARADDAKAQAVLSAAVARKEQQEAAASAKQAEQSEAKAKKSEAKAEESEAKAEDALALAKQEEQAANASAVEAQHDQKVAEEKKQEAKHQRAIAVDQKRKTEDQRKRAIASKKDAKQQARLNRAGKLAARSAAKLNVDGEKSIQLAYLASRLDPSEPAQDALLNALAAFRLRAVLPGGGRPVRTAASSRDSRSVVTAAAKGRPLRTAVFSPDSRFVVTVSSDGEVRLFNVQSGRQVHVFKPRAEVAVASFSPDARTFVVGTLDGRALLWSVDTGALRKVLYDPDVAGAVNAADFTSDGRLIVTGGEDGMVRVWEPASGLLLLTIEIGEPVRSLSLQPGGHHAAVVTRQNSARVVDIETGATVPDLDPPGGITVAAFSPSGDVLVGGGDDGQGYIWDTQSWQRNFILTGHASTITDVAFAPGYPDVMTTSADTTARLWEIKTGKPDGTFTGWHRERVVSGSISSRKGNWATASDDGTAALWVGAALVVLDGHGGAVTRVVFSPDGSNLLTASADGNARLWRARDPVLGRIANQGERTTTAAFSPSGDRLVTVSGRGTGRLYATKGKLLKTLPRLGRVNDIAFSSSGWFATAGYDGNARLFRPDGSSGAVFPHGSLPIRAVAMTPNGRLVAAGGDDGRVAVFDRAGNVVKDFAQGAPVTSVAFASTESLVGGGADGSVKVFDLRDGVGDRSLPSHRGAVTDISLTPDGLLATASDDKTAQVYDLRTGKLRRSALQGHATAVNLVLFSPDGQKLLTASTDGDVRTWSTKNWQHDVLRGIRAPEIGAHHNNTVNAARFSPDGRWIVTGGLTAAGIWQTRTGDLLYFIRGHTNGVSAVTFAPNSWKMMTAGADGTMRSYRCELCGDLSALQRLARADLALAARG